MTMWREVSCDEVRRIIVLAAKSCSLDPIPTNLLRDCIDAILPYLTAMVNASMPRVFAGIPEEGSCDTALEEAVS